MTNDEKSVGDDNTCSGGPRGRDDSPMSLGDEATFGDASSGCDAVFDDGMEIVDLAARYKTEGVLGRGGMGEVLLATDTRLNRKVAIKRILGEAAKSKTAVKRLLTEAQSIAALNHPCIVQIYDYGRAVDGPFLIMEYVEGSSLLEKCREGAVPIEQAIDLTCQLCDGLGKAHAAGIIHRDIKPANVLLTADGVPKLTDFGLAKDESGDLGHTVTGAVLGTLDFMPPEQRKDAALTDNRSDLWSLAATLYQMVTGKSPKIIKFNDVPQSLQDVLGKALEDSKDDRYQTARELRDALTGALQKAGDVQDLNQGECPSCGVKNEGSRKFCKGCGEKLEAECLSCHAEIPLWEEFCGSCGSQQSVLLDLRKEDHAKEQALAEEQLRIGDFGSAQTIAERLANESDPRLRTIKAWAKSFLPEVKQQREQQTRAAQQSVAEARQHFAAHDYESTLKALAQIPSGIRLAGVNDLTSRAGAAQEEVRSLADQIRTRVEARELSGLIKLVDRYLELKPGEERFETLQKSLQARDAKQQKAQQEALKQAQALFSAGNDEAGLIYIEGLGEDQKTPDVREIREKILSRRRTRLKIVSDYQQKHFAGLLDRVTRYLSEVQGDEEVESIGKRLTDRDRKLKEQLAQLLTRIETAELAGEFQKALTLLEKVPDECWTDDFEERRQELNLLTTARAAVLKQLAEAEDRSAVKLALQAVEDYQTGFAEMTSRDETFTTAVNRAKKQLTIFKDQEAAAQRRRRLKIRLYSALALMLVIAAGAGTAWLSHQQKVNDAIADARNRGDAALNASEFTTAIAAFDEVLQLAPKDAAALLARAEANLRQPAPNLPAAESDLASAIASGAASNHTQPIKWLLICGKTEAFSVAGEISDAKASLRELSLHGATADLINRAKLAIGTALIKRARDAAEKFRAEDALADLNQASELSVAPSEIQQAGQLVATAFAENARGIINLEEFDRALALLGQAQTLDPANTEIARVESELYARRAQKSLLNDDRDAASADFLKARQLNPQGSELGRLAAQLANGLVQRCETAFSDTACQEATAALATVTEVDPNNTDVADLKTRLGGVLLAEADKAVAGKDVDRTAGLAEAIAELNVLPIEQARLLTAAAGLLFEQGQVQIQQNQLMEAANTIVRIQAMPVDETQKTQALEALMSELEPTLIAGLKSPTPQPAVDALTSLQNTVTVSATFSKALGELPKNVRELLPERIRVPPLATTPFDAAQARAHQQAWADYLGVTVETTNSIGMQFVVIPPGEFMMGSPDEEPGRGDQAVETLHRVTLTQSFEMGMHEVTQEQYQIVMGSNPAEFKSLQNPVESVTWDDAVDFCRRLSSLPAEQSAGYVYRLPTEAEWEYTCRAGTDTQYSFGNDDSQLGTFAWFGNNSGDKRIDALMIWTTDPFNYVRRLLSNNGHAHSVGRKQPNPWGLYDMHGNVWERCQDWYGDYPSGAATDPTGPSSGSSRAVRGGSWSSPSEDCRSADRTGDPLDSRSIHNGFRVLRSSVE